MPVLVQLWFAGDKKEAETSAELWCFIPRAQAELPLEQVYDDWPVSADPDVHAKKSANS
jgi:hypothetical protein